MTRDPTRDAQTLLLKALGSQPGTGMTAKSLQRLTGLSPSLLQEVITVLLDAGRVTLRLGDGRRTHTEYHLVQPHEPAALQEGPLSPSAHQVLTVLGHRSKGAQAIAKVLQLERSAVQVALDELEAFRRVERRQVGMLVMYRSRQGASPPEA